MDMDTYADFKLPRSVHHDRSKKSSTGHYHTSHRTTSTPAPSAPTPTSNGTVLGRFLKLGKSKSDANGYSLNKPSRSRSTAPQQDDIQDDDFRVVTTTSRSPVNRMVHNKIGGPRKEVSRSHSWIYGSVKLQSDLPFGYGSSFNPGGGSTGHSSVHSSSSHSPNSSSSPSTNTSIPATNNNNNPNQQFSSSAGSSIKPCQNANGKQLEFCGACDCTSDFDFLRPDQTSAVLSPSVYALPPLHQDHANYAAYCAAHHGHMPQYPHGLVGAYALPPNGIKGKQAGGSSNKDESKFVSSVRKLTWKSLKQVVKKRPSLDNVLKLNKTSSNDSTLPPPFTSIQAAIPDTLFAPGSTDYFFPDKKNYYASCSDLHDAPPYMTASVRVRPKPPRQSWDFPNEFGPVPNYQKDDQIYHSEWDLRQFMPYDVWLNATNNNNNNNNNHDETISDAYPLPTNQVQIAKIPKANRSNPSSSNTSSSEANSKSKGKTNSSQSHTSTFETSKKRKSNASSHQTDKSSINNNGSIRSLHSLKNSSILEPELSAYQLIKQQQPSSSKTGDSTKLSAEDSDDLSDNALNDDPVRICGQGIYMPPKNLIVPSSSITATKQQNPSVKQDPKKIIIDTTARYPEDLKRDAAASTGAPPPRHMNNDSRVVSTKINPSTNPTTIDYKPDHINSTAKMTLTKSNGASAHISPPASFEVDIDDNPLYQAALFNLGRPTKLSFTNSDYNTAADDMVFEKPGELSSSSSSNVSSATSMSIGGGRSTTSSQQDPGRNRVKFSISDYDRDSESRQEAEDAKKAGASQNRYGAMKKRKSRSKQLQRETIYEEDSENSDDNKTYAVKIIVSHSNNMSEYVKPILKKVPPLNDASENVYDSSSSFKQHQQQQEEGNGSGPPNSNRPGINNITGTCRSPPPPTRSVKKVQFDQNQTIVCHGLSSEEDYEEDGNDSDCTLVRAEDEDHQTTSLHDPTSNDWITVDELETGPTTATPSPPPATATPSNAQTLQPPQKEQTSHKPAPALASKLYESTNVLQQQQKSTKQPEKALVQEPQPKIYEAPQQRSSEPPQQTTFTSSNSSKSASSELTTIILTGAAGTSRILNPNSLLFHDTTRIRLNQTRPSLENSFKLNLSTQRQNNPKGTNCSSPAKSSSSSSPKSSARIKQSHSFRHSPAPSLATSQVAHTSSASALRPREPPPPPPPAVTYKKQQSAAKKQTSQPAGPVARKVNATHTKAPQPRSTSNNEAPSETPVRNRTTTAGSANSNKASSASKTFPNKSVLKQSHQTSTENKQQRALDALTEQLKQRTREQNNIKKSAGSPQALQIAPVNNREQSSAPSNATNNATNVEIVTKANSVSEIRIYSTPSVQNQHPSQQVSEVQHQRPLQEMHYAATNLVSSSNLQSNENSRERADSRSVRATSSANSAKQTSNASSTSVVLIVDGAKNTTSPPLPPATTSHTTSEQASVPTPTTPAVPTSSAKSLPPARPAPAPATTPTESRIFHLDSETPRQRAISNEYVCTDTFKQLSRVPAEEPLYDDVVTPPQVSSSSFDNGLHMPPPQAPPPPPPPLSEEPIYSDASSESTAKPSIYSTRNRIIYDDTLSLISSTYSGKTNGSIRDIYRLNDPTTDEPLYDDVMNLGMPDSDSGAETEELPPPLPSQGPPTHLLGKISTDLPILNFPLLQSSKTSKSKSASATSNTSAPHANQNGADQESEEEILDRTRSLLLELNEKLTKLNFPPGNDYATYISKVVISSSSESSGVEEDYNSEKNFSLTRGGSSASQQQQYRLNAISKLASDTISMARGKFLDSMKTTSPNNAAKGATPKDSEEPIYEEIRELQQQNRSGSPIYADAFDTQSLFESSNSASKNEILSFLESIRDRLTAGKTSSLESSSSSSRRVRNNGVSIDRNDSGIGSESGSLPITASLMNLPSTSVVRKPANNNVSSDTTSTTQESIESPTFNCKDCDGDSSDSLLSLDSKGQVIQEQTIMGQPVSSGLCPLCLNKRSERKEILQEIYETEVKYCRDLKIVMFEFYKRFQAGGLLTKEQLENIFLNVQQLIDISQQLASVLRTNLESAVVKKDYDLMSVNFGKIFLDFGEVMMDAFEYYCTRQASAVSLLTQLEKEKELLRIFLQVSQMENANLRRMNLPAFLMVPVQRITRYPLLLGRLLKVTPKDHESRADIYLAQQMIEQHLEHINKVPRDAGGVKLWRKISSIHGTGNGSPTHRRSNSDLLLDDVISRVRKMAFEVLDWTTASDAACIIEGQFSVLHLNGKPVRQVYACLLARGQDLDNLAGKMDQPVFFPPAEGTVKEVKLVLVRVKNARIIGLLSDPLCLSKCVVAQAENDFQDCVEINEIITKNTYYFQGMDKQSTAEWLRLLQCHAVCVGQWRRRRGALANIMMSGVIREV